MRSHLRSGALIVAAALLLSGCMGWMVGGPHHGHWNDDERSYGPGYRCSEQQRGDTAAGPPCPYRR
jgi:hypothetical protein